MPNRLFSNVGDYIDPDDVPATTGERVNIGDYIDPDELPEYANAEVNIGAYIDPEELPEGRMSTLTSASIWTQKF